MSPFSKCASGYAVLVSAGHVRLAAEWHFIGLYRVFPPPALVAFPMLGPEAVHSPFNVLGTCCFIDVVGSSWG